MTLQKFSLLQFEFRKAWVELDYRSRLMAEYRIAMPFAMKLLGHKLVIDLLYPRLKQVSVELNFYDLVSAQQGVAAQPPTFLSFDFLS